MYKYRASFTLFVVLDCCKAYCYPWSTNKEFPNNILEQGYLNIPLSSTSSSAHPLSRYSHYQTSDDACFSLLPEHSCDLLGNSESLRKYYATKFALCEIEQASTLNVPNECLDLKESTTGFCITAFSRSPQHWSSYSGYLRDIVKLCSAYERWNDIDQSKKIYNQLYDNLTDFVQDLTTFYGFQLDKENITMQTYQDSYAMLMKLFEQNQDYNKQIQKNINDYFDKASKLFIQNIYSNLENLVYSVETSLTNLVQNHVDSLSLVETRLDFASNNLKFYSGKLGDEMEEIESRLIIHGNDLNALTNRLIPDIEKSLNGLDQGIINNINASNKHHELLLKLFNQTVQEIDSINGRLGNLDIVNAIMTKVGGLGTIVRSTIFVLLLLPVLKPIVFIMSNLVMVLPYHMIFCFPRNRNNSRKLSFKTNFKKHRKYERASRIPDRLLGEK